MLRIVIICLIFWLPGDAAAKNIVQGYRDYKSASGHKAFAFGSLGAWAYVSGRASASQAKQTALHNCRTQIKKHHGPCHLGDVDGRVVHKRFKEVLYDDFVQPIKITIKDKKTGKVVSGRGALNSGPIWSWRKGLARVTGSDGKVVCSQIWLNSIPRTGGRFHAKCFGQRLSGKFLVGDRRKSGFYKGSFLFSLQMSNSNLEITYSNILSGS